MKQVCFGNCSLILPFKDRRCVGGKKSKERITILIGSNMSGDEKLPILVIGKFAKLRCFKNVKSLPDNLIYRHSKRAWMTTNLFQEYVYNLDIKFSQQIRKVAIMIDNCPAHPVLTNLKSIEMIRLPKNTTSKTQPMDAGVIKQFKENIVVFLPGSESILLILKSNFLSIY